MKALLALPRKPLVLLLVPSKPWVHVEPFSAILVARVLLPGCFFLGLCALQPEAVRVARDQQDAFAALVGCRQHCADIVCVDMLSDSTALPFALCRFPGYNESSGVSTWQ